MSETVLQSYSLDVECPNCHFIKKGFDVTRGKKLKDMECPQCGNNTLVESIQTSSYYEFQ